MISAFTRGMRDTLLTFALNGTPLGGDTVTLRPFYNDIVPTPELVDGQLEFSDDSLRLNPPTMAYPGSGAIQGYDDLNESAAILDTFNAAVGTNISDSPTIYGMAALHASDSGDDSTGILYAFRLDEPIPLSFTGQLVELPFVLALANNMGGSGNVT